MGTSTHTSVQMSSVTRIAGKQVAADRVRWIGVKLVKSPIGAAPKVRDTLTALRLTKMQKKVYQPNKPTVLGMINKAKHHVEIFDVSESEEKPEVPKRPMQL